MVGEAGHVGSRYCVGNVADYLRRRRAGAAAAAAT